MTTPQPTHMLWLDLETTDTEPTEAAILEIGAVITDWSPQLREIAAAQMLIRPPGNTQDHTTLWYRTPDPVKRMHTESGLWLEATTSPDAWSIHDADPAFASWVRSNAELPLPLAGSGVGHLDLPFVKAWMPATAALLTYWPVDIGNMRRMLDLAGRSDHVDLATDIDAKPHRGLPDVRLHLVEARRYLALLGDLPVLPVLEPATGGEQSLL